MSLADLAVPRLVSQATLSADERLRLFEGREPLFACLYLGVVTLDTAVTGRGFGALPSLGELSTLPKHAGITAVGYGLQKSFPDSASFKDQAVRIRMVATPNIREIDTKKVGDYAFITSHNANTGGTCFGDSGGPNFIGDSNVVGGVTSFGTTFTCKGHNGAYRVDQQDDLDWLATFGLTPA